MSALIGAVGAMTRRKGDSDPYWSNVSALLRFSGANNSTDIIDETGKVWTRFGTDAPRISTDQAIFGPSSLLTNTTGGAPSCGVDTGASADFDFDVGDFTIEWYQYWKSLSAPLYQAAFQRGYAVPGALTMVTGAGDGKYGLYVGSGTAVICAESSPGATNQWVHYAVTRLGNDFTIWRGGIASAAGSNSSSLSAIGKRLSVGSYASDSGARGQVFGGHIGVFRVTKGVARYTAPFAPPTAPFPAG